MNERVAEREGEAPQPRPDRVPSYRGIRVRVSLKWLLLGALIYALLLLVAIRAQPNDLILPFLGPSFYLTPVFGLPFVLRTVHRPGRLRRLVYFLLLLPPVHMAAIYLAYYHGLSSFRPLDAADTALRTAVSGAWGGATGAVFAFTLLYLMRLTARRRAELATMGLAVIALSALGGAGVGAALLYAGDGLTSAIHDPERLIVGYELIHLPWQILFALALAWLMRPPHAPKRAATPPAAPPSEFRPSPAQPAPSDRS